MRAETDRYMQSILDARSQRVLMARAERPTRAMMPPPIITTDNVIRLVEQWTGIGRDELFSRRRNAAISAARFMAYYLLYKAGHVHEHIGAIFGRHHSTVSHGVESVAIVLRESSTIAAMIRQMMVELNIMEAK